MHLPFAEASMSHKHRKRTPRVTGEQGEGQEEQDQAEENSDDSLFSPADADTDFLQQPPSLATEVRRTCISSVLGCKLHHSDPSMLNVCLTFCALLAQWGSERCSQRNELASW